MEDLICYHNGKYITESEIKISILDAAIMEGMAFDLGRTYNHVPFFWEDHIDRLFRSLQYFHISPGLTPDEMYRITLEVFKRNEKFLEPEDDFVVIQRVSRGASTYFYSPPTHPTVIVNCVNLLPIYERQAQWYKDGIHLVIANTRQIPPQCLDVKSKNTNRLCNILADFEAKMVDPEAWALMLDIYGRVAEGTRYNCFLVKNNKLFTPKSDNILGGVTRGTLLRLASEIGIEATETDLYVYDLYNADEIFLTACSTTIWPVAKFNEKILAKPIPGPVTQQLFTAFSKEVGVDIVQRVVNYVANKKKASQ